MSKIKVDIDQLKREGVIDEATADRILGFYTNEKDPSSGNRLFLIFGVFGALMIGLGIILIIAHNWEQLSRLQKTIIAFIPMLLSQLACWYTLFKKSDSKPGEKVRLYF